MTSLLFNIIRLGLEPLATILYMDIPKINNLFSFNVCNWLQLTSISAECLDKAIMAPCT